MKRTYQPHNTPSKENTPVLEQECKTKSGRQIIMQEELKVEKD